MKIDDRYDRWTCAQCGRERIIPSLPIQHPRCCGEGMWFSELMHGKPYEWDNSLPVPSK